MLIGRKAMRGSEMAWLNLNKNGEGERFKYREKSKGKRDQKNV